MRVAFIQDYDIFSFGGGAEMNDAAHFTEGLKRGYDMNLLGPTHPYARYDLLIASNFTMFDFGRIKNMVDRTPTVFFFHDYIFCNHRLYYSMNDKCSGCLKVKDHLEIYLKAKLLIWLSPLHRDATLHCMPELKNSKYALIPSAIRPDLFLHTGDSVPLENRNDSYLSVNSMYYFKGRENLVKYIKSHPEINFTIVGKEQVKGLPNVFPIEYLDYADMPKVYASHKKYIELPNTPQPFNRTVIEAKLSGCKIITNKLMGCASWDWFQEDKYTIAHKVREAPINFWNAIEEAL
jgi:hypothetical protein